MATDKSTSTSTSTPLRILIINPNSSTHMTDALKPVVEGMGLPSVEYTFFTSPTPGVPSINSPADAQRSADICYPALVPLVPHHDAFLVACYSAHPLVGLLKAECERIRGRATTTTTATRKYVTGILEASCLVSVNLVGSSSGGGSTGNGSGGGSNYSNNNNNGFGIVSTGKIWESALQVAVQEFLGIPDSNAKANANDNKKKLERFYGCETTGLNATELHALPAEQVGRKMMEATKRLLRRGAITTTTETETVGRGGIATNTDLTSSPSTTYNYSSRVKAICLGCAGMVGLESAVRTACIEELGVEAGNAVSIVDGVRAGVGVLYALARCGF